MRLLLKPVLIAASVAPLFAQSPQPKMGAPLHGLSSAELQAFTDGLADFSTPLTPAQGLGPLFNQVSCANCHNNPVGGPGGTKVTRFGYDDGKGGFDPLTGLGGSLLQQGATNPAAVEVVPGAANVVAQRVTPSVLGAGLIEAIADADILANELSPPNSYVSGRVHWVTPLEDPNGPQRAGRMGWKAQLATVLSFSADAAQNEMGLTNRLIPAENAPNGNLALLNAYDPISDPEDGPDSNGLDFIDRITDFQRYLAAPPQTPRSGMSGEAVFESVGCADCHIGSWTTSSDPSLEAAIRNKAIKPYSDFLLHDMGVSADFIGDGDAGTQELRTPSLWGVRSRNALWHDGRVVGGTLQSRILGPGGVVELHASLGSESRQSALTFQSQTLADQLAVVAFLDSLGRAEFDWDGDNDLDEVDLAAFVAAMGNGPYTADDPEAVFDINQDGVVDNVDRDAFALVYEADCDGNGTNDLADVVFGGADDSNQNLVPDECEYCQVDLGFAGAGALRIDVCGDDLTASGARATFRLVDGAPGAPAIIVIGVGQSPTLITSTEYLVPSLPLSAVVELFVTDANGELHLPVFGAGNLPTLTWVFQAATYDGVSYDLSNAVEVEIGSF